MNLGKINRHSIAISSFTSVLGQYEGMPSVLYSIGALPTERPPTVAIIGSRKPSAYGTEVTRLFARQLANRGVVILSGLAYGVDAIAHEAALEAGGTTVAILAGGLHSIYPKRHTALAARIAKNGGALISEYAPGVEPRPYFFLARNRIVSGLADAVLVTEATDKSGTFSTIAHAISQNKEVFAVPGPITSLLSAGPHRLLQTGAHIACEPDDILRVIAPHLLASSPLQSALFDYAPDDPSIEARIFNCIKNGQRDGDSIQRQVMASGNSTIAEYLQSLSLLELNGSIRALGGNQWSLN